MNDTRIYRIRLRGRVDADEVNAMSPLQVAGVSASAEATLFCVRADQSGLIGLMRHLHALGFVFLSVDTDPE